MKVDPKYLIDRKANLDRLVAIPEDHIRYVSAVDPFNKTNSGSPAVYIFKNSEGGLVQQMTDAYENYNTVVSEIQSMLSVQ